MRSREEREQERREYESEVRYDVWRSGGDPDGIDYDKLRDSFYDGCRSDDVAREVLRDQRQRSPDPEESPEREAPDAP